MSDVNVSLVALFVASVVSLLVTPGPVTLLVVRAGLVGGMGQALRTIAGTNAASLVLIGVSALLIQGVLALDEAVMVGIRLLGCAYISWLACGMVREAWASSTSAGAASASAGWVAAPAGWVRGFAVGIANPKDIVFFASFFPQFLAVLPSPGHSMVLLTVLWVVLDFATLTLLAVLLRKLAGPRLQQRLLLLAAVLLLLIGVGGGIHALYALWELLLP